LFAFFFFAGGRSVAPRFVVGNKIFLRSIEARPPAHRIDGLEACGRNQPGARLVRNASLRPGLQRGGECLMHGLFGEIQISEHAHERRQNPARFRPVKGLNGVAELFRHRRRHLAKLANRLARYNCARASPYPQPAGGFMRQRAGGTTLMRYSFTKPFCLKTSTSSCSTSNGLPFAMSLNLHTWGSISTRTRCPNGHCLRLAGL